MRDRDLSRSVELLTAWKEELEEKEGVFKALKVELSHLKRAIVHKQSEIHEELKRRVKK